MVTKPPVTRGPSPRRPEDDGFRQTPAAQPAPDAGVEPVDAAAGGGAAATARSRRPSALRARARATLRVIRSNLHGLGDVLGVEHELRLGREGRPWQSGRPRSGAISGRRGEGDQRPLNRGGRLSAKARSPSS